MAPAGCNPRIEPCDVRLRVPIEAPGNAQDQNPGAVIVYWFEGGTPPPVCNPNCGQISNCGVPGLDGPILVDFFETYIEAGSVSCTDLTSPLLEVYSVSVLTCPGSVCEQQLDVPDLDLSSADLSLALGCIEPRWWSCPEAAPGTCPLCLPGGASPAGGGSGVGPGAGGPGGGDLFGPQAALRYAAGDAGGPGLPCTSDWKAVLGRYWSHDYALRVVPHPDESFVFLITESGTFRAYGDLAAGVCQTAVPSDEHHCASGGVKVTS